MSKKIDTDSFIKSAMEVHGSKYDYSKVVYIRAKDHVCIICPYHGEFWQAPDKHLHGRGCPRCARPNSGLTQEEFVKKCAIANKNKYDYSKTIYNGYTKDVVITCPAHGDFTIKAVMHLFGHGCQRCGGSGRYTTEEFVAKHKNIFGNKYDYSQTNLERRVNNKICVICPEHGAYYRNTTDHFKSGCPKCNRPNHGMGTEGFIKKARMVHGDKFDYRKSIYKGIFSKIRVTCPNHGDIEVVPNNFLRGFGCQQCAIEELTRLKVQRASEEFESKARSVHGDKYDYSQVHYKTAKEKVCILCPEHGEFWQTPNGHLNGCQCPRCTHRSWAYTTEEYVAKAKEQHGELYDYSKVVYKNNHTNIIIGCPEHGDVEINPGNHLDGAICPICTSLKIESSQERNVRYFLEKQNIKYQREKQFDWLHRGRSMPLDFFLPEYNVGIECQGYQHFKPHVFFGGEEGLKDVQARDQLKKHLCDENGVRLIYYSDLNMEYPYEVHESLSSLHAAILGKNYTSDKDRQMTLIFDDNDLE